MSTALLGQTKRKEKIRSDSSESTEATKKVKQSGRGRNVESKTSSAVPSFLLEDADEVMLPRGRDAVEKPTSSKKTKNIEALFGVKAVKTPDVPSDDAAQDDESTMTAKSKKTLKPHKEFSDDEGDDDDAPLFGDDDDAAGDMGFDDDDDDADVKSKRSSKSRGSARDDQFKAKAASIFSTLSFETMSMGMSVVGAVIEIHEHEIVLKLADGCTAFVTMREISDVAANLVDRFIEETEQKGTSVVELPNLNTFFEIGNIVRGVIVKLPDFTKRLKGPPRAEVSLRPSLVQAGLTIQNIGLNLSLVGAVRSIEEKGYLIDLGIPTGNGSETLIGFLPKAPSPAAHPKRLNVGQVIDVVTTSVPSEGSRVVTLTASPLVVKRTATTKASFYPDANIDRAEAEKKSNATLDHLRAGHLVRATIERVIPRRGLVLNFWNQYSGFVPVFHLTVPYHAGLDLPAIYKVNQRVRARILFVDAINKSIQLTLRPSLVEDLSVAQFPESLGIGKILETARITAVVNSRALLVNLEAALTHNERLQVVAAASKASAGAPKDANATDTSEETILRAISTGYVSRREVSDRDSAEKLEDMKVGSVLHARVIGHDFLLGMPLLSLRESVLSRLAFRPSELVPGTTVTAKVTKVLSNAVLMSIAGTSFRGYLSASHMVDAPSGATNLSTAQRAKYALDSEHKVRILSIADTKVFLTAKPKILRSPVEECVASYDDIAKLIRMRTQTLGERPVPVIIHGVISRVYDSGIRVRFFGDLHGFIKADDLVRTGHIMQGQKPQDASFVELATVATRVIGFKPEARYLGLSLGTTERAIAADPRLPSVPFEKINEDVSGISVGDIVTGYIKDWATQDITSTHAVLNVILDHPDDQARKLKATLSIMQVLDHGALDRVEDVVDDDLDNEDALQFDMDEDEDEDEDQIDFEDDEDAMEEPTARASSKRKAVVPESDEEEEEEEDEGEVDENPDNEEDDDSTSNLGQRYVISYQVSKAATLTAENLIRTGTKAKFIVLGINRRTGEIKLSLRNLFINTAQAMAKQLKDQSKDDTSKRIIAMPQSDADITPGMTVLGFVVHTAETTAKVRLLGGVMGLVTLGLTPSVLGNRKGSNLQHSLTVGQSVLATVVSKLDKAQDRKNQASVLLKPITETGSSFSSKFSQVAYEDLVETSKLAPSSKALSVVNVGSVVNHAKLDSGLEDEAEFVSVKLPMYDQAQSLNYVAIADKEAGHAPEEIISEALKKSKREDMVKGKRALRQVACRVLRICPSLTEEEPSRVYVSMKPDLVEGGQIIAAEARAELSTLQSKNAALAASMKPTAGVSGSFIEYLTSKSFFGAAGRTASNAKVRARIELVIPEEGSVIVSLPDHHYTLAWASLSSTSVDFTPLALSEAHAELKPGMEYTCRVVSAPRDILNLRNAAVIVELPFEDILARVEGRSVKSDSTKTNRQSKFQIQDDGVNALDVDDVEVGSVLKDVATVVGISTHPNLDGPVRIFVKLGNSSVFGRVTIAEISDESEDQPWGKFEVGDTLPLVTVLAVDKAGPFAKKGADVKNFICSLRPSRATAVSEKKQKSKKPVADAKTNQRAAFSTEVRVDIINPEELTKGMLLQGYVLNVTKMGIFVAISQYLTGIIRLSDVSDSFVEFDKLKKQILPGNLVIVRAIANGADSKQADGKFRAVPMSMKESVVQNTTVKMLEALEPMMIVKGRVTQVRDVGVLVQLKHTTITALAHISECADTKITSEQLQQHYKPGDKVKAVVLNVSRSHGKVSIALKASRFQEAQARAASLSKSAAKSSAAAAASDSEDDDDEEETKSGYLRAEDDSESSEDELQIAKAERAKYMSVLSASKSGAAAVPAATSAITSKKVPTTLSSVADVEAAATKAATASPFTSFVFDLAAQSAKQKLVDAKREAMSSKLLAEDAVEEEVETKSSKASKKDKTQKKKKDSKPVVFDDEEGELLSISDDEDESEFKSHRSSMQSILEAERALMEDGAPKTEDDHERNLVRHPSNSYLWVQYIAYFIERSEFTKARAVAERALSTISVAEVAERWNVWVAMLSLEVSYGSKQSLEAVVKRAQKYNDATKVLTELARIQQAAEKPDDASATWEAAAKRIGTAKGEQTIQVYSSWIELWFASGNVTKAREILTLALSKLPLDAQLPLMIRVAQFEYDYHYQGGSAERGRTMFEKIFSEHPKRLDVWAVLVDKEIKSFRQMKGRAGVRSTTVNARLKAIRDVFDLAANESKWKVYNAKQMRFVFGKFITFEQEFGNEASLEVAQSKARAYVESINQ